MFHANGYDKGCRETRLAIWERIHERSGRQVQELVDRPVLRDELVYLWQLYNDLARGCERLTYQDIDAYQCVTGTVLDQFEVSVMFDIDLMRIKASAG